VSWISIHLRAKWGVGAVTQNGKFYFKISASLRGERERVFGWGEPKMGKMQLIEVGGRETERNREK
jgi:hypothetical protein